MEHRLGLSLIELVIYLTISLALIVLVFAFVTSYSSHTQRWQTDVARLCQTAGALQLMRHDLMRAPSESDLYYALEETHVCTDIDGARVSWRFDEKTHQLTRSAQRPGRDAETISLLAGVERVSFQPHRSGKVIRALSVSFLCAGKQITHTIALRYDQIHI